MSVLQESKNYIKLDAMFTLKSLDEYCTKCLNSKFTAFWILVLHLSKRYCKLDVIYALKSLHHIALNDWTLNLLQFGYLKFIEVKGRVNLRYFSIKKFAFILSRMCKV